MSSQPINTDVHRVIEQAVAEELLRRGVAPASGAAQSRSWLSRQSVLAAAVALAVGAGGMYAVMKYQGGATPNDQVAAGLKNWEILAWFLGAGAVGGLVNSVIANNFRPPSLIRTQVDGQARLDLGFLANVLAGVSAAYATTWVTNPDLSLENLEAEVPNFTLSARAVLMAFAAGVLGSRAVTSNGTVSLLTDQLVKALTMPANPAAAQAVKEKSTTGVGAIEAMNAAVRGGAAAVAGGAAGGAPPAAPPPAVPPLPAADSARDQLRQLVDPVAVKARFAEMSAQGIPNPVFDHEGTNMSLAVLRLSKPIPSEAQPLLKKLTVKDVTPHATFLPDFVEWVRKAHPAEFVAAPLPVLAEAFDQGRRIAVVLAQVSPATSFNATFFE